MALIGNDATDRPKILASATDGLPEFMWETGLSFPDLLRASGIPLSALDDHSQYISLDRFARLLEFAAMLADDDVLALRFACSQEVRASGALAYAIRHAPTVHEGFMTLVRYIRARVDVGHMELVVERRTAMLEWSLSPLLVQRTQITDYAAGSIVRRAASMIHPSWRPRAVSLQRAPPTARDYHRHVFGSEVRFAHAVNGIVIDAAELEMPVPGADPYLRRLALDTLDRTLSDRNAATDLASQVQEEIMAGLEQRQTPEIRRVARRLGLSTRNLQRRLADGGSSFQSLLDQCRQIIAYRLLENPSVPLSQIAYRVGFSAPSALTRAAHRWFGASPKDVRQRLAAHVPARTPK